MKYFLFSVLMLMSITHAAQNLVVDGTEFKFNGQKIFFSGINLAWIDYNSDVGATALNENTWRKAVQDIRSAGGNSIRWWLFNNMSVSPTVNTSTNLVSGLPANTINNIKKALDIAEEYGVMVSLCLFSHNLMEDNQYGNYNGKIPIEANKKLFTDEGITAFINNALKPVLQAVGNHNALWTWELFNEPEGMATGIPNAAWTSQTTAMSGIQKFSNRVAAAIHAHDNTLLVSNGIHNTDAFQYWTDAALRNAGGENNGVLDFYQVHFYPEHQSSAQNPFDHPFSYWNLTKPLVIGEFSAAGWNKEQYPAYRVASKTPAQLYLYAYEQGYAGALSWEYKNFNDNVAGSAVNHNFAAAKPGMEAVAAKYGQYIEIGDFTPPVTGGNGVMQVTYENVNSEATIEYENATPNLTGNATITFKVRTVNSPAFSLRLVVKSGDDWTWNDTDKSCSVPANGEWVTCSYNLTSDFNQSVTVSNVRSFLIQTFNNGYSGVIQFDDFKAGTRVITDFDEQYDVFGVAASMDGGDAIKKIETVYIDGGVTPSSSSRGVSSSSSRPNSSSSGGVSSSSSGTTPIKVLSSTPIEFNVRSLNNGTLLVESNASTAIHLYDTKGNLAQNVQVPAGSSIVQLSVSAGIYVVKNSKTRQTKIVVVK